MGELCVDLIAALADRAQIASTSLVLDRKIRFRVDPKTALAIRTLRAAHLRNLGARIAGRAVEARWQALLERCLAPPEATGGTGKISAANALASERPRTTLTFVPAPAPVRSNGAA